MKAHKFSLLAALAAALLLSAAFVPRANATLITYFNFEDGTLGSPGFDGAADVIPANGGDNPGGGTQNSTLTYSGNTDSTAAALAIAGSNRTAADTDIPANTGHVGLGLELNPAKNNNTAFLEFNVNTLGLSQFSLSFAVDNNGNGFASAQLSYSSTGNSPGSFTNVGSPITITNGPNQILTSGTFNVTPSATGFFRLTFSGATSNGNDRQTVIDNIQLNAVPEPSTVMGGLLGACGLCWHQRRRLIRSLRLRGA